MVEINSFVSGPFAFPIIAIGGFLLVSFMTIREMIMRKELIRTIAGIGIILCIAVLELCSASAYYSAK